MMKTNMRALLVAPLGLLAMAVSPALAQDAGTAPVETPVAEAQPAPAPSENAPSENAMVNLVRLLVQQGTLTAEAGNALIAQAEGEAAQARRMASGELPAAQAGAIRVPYIPATVRQQIKDELRTEVLAEARAQGYASPGEAAPDWTRRITIGGDLRVRSESVFYSDANALGQFVNWGAFNAAGPQDISAPDFFLPFLNSTEDRLNQLRFRARLNIVAEVSPAVQVGFQLATGDSRSPISTNASLGGGLEKRDIWLQYAYARVRPIEQATVWLGRFANPFTHSDLHFDEDLALDGVMAEFDGGKFLADGAVLAVRGGAFPLDFGNANFPNAQLEKAAFPEKYLFSGQIEAGYPIVEGGMARISAAYHSYDNVQGALSDACIVGAPDCSTDALALLNPTKGNTVRFLRQNVIDTSNPRAPTGNPQFVGLTFDYDILDINASVALPIDDEVSVMVSGNYVRNLGFDEGALCGDTEANGNGGPINNVTINDTDDIFCTDGGRFVGGNQGWQAAVRFGHAKAGRFGQWWVEGGYRYLESDAVLDAFTDSNFALGGTNHEGWFLGGRTGLVPGTHFGLTWRSTNSIDGPDLAVDVLQVDLSAEF